MATFDLLDWSFKLEIGKVDQPKFCPKFWSKFWGLATPKSFAPLTNQNLAQNFGRNFGFCGTQNLAQNFGRNFGFGVLTKISQNLPIFFLQSPSVKNNFDAEKFFEKKLTNPNFAPLTNQNFAQNFGRNFGFWRTPKFC